MRNVLIILSLFVAPGVQACGADSDCRVGDRSYRISLPENVETPVGAVVWSHGYRGSAQGVMRNGSLRRMIHDKGFALIAAQGIGGTWDLPNGPRTMQSTGAAEFAYFKTVIDDAQERFDIDPDRLIASGFSAGGMMVWNLACARPDMFAGFVPLSGTYWLQPPDQCAPEVASIVHIHGMQDQTVPLDGRPIGQTHQGRVSDALATYAAHGNFANETLENTALLDCANMTGRDNAILEFCLFEGGHSFRTEYLAHGIDRLIAGGQLE